MGGHMGYTHSQQLTNTVINQSNQLKGSNNSNQFIYPASHLHAFA